MRGGLVEREQQVAYAKEYVATAEVELQKMVDVPLTQFLGPLVMQRPALAIQEVARPRMTSLYTRFRSRRQCGTPRDG